MTAFFLDASVLLAAEDADDANHAASRTLLRSTNSIATLDLAYYETNNVAIRSWNDAATAARLRRRIAVIARDGGVSSATAKLLDDACGLATAHGISVYDASYAAAAASRGDQLVSCDVRDLVSRGLAILPRDAVGS